MSAKSITGKTRGLAALLLAAWAIVLVRILVFKQLRIKTSFIILDFSGTRTGPANLIPLKTILPYLRGQAGWLIAFFNLAGNIGLLLPVGALLAVIFRRMTWRGSVLAGVTAGLTIETLQAVFRVGIFDVDDITLNALGVVTGFLATKAVTLRWPPRLR